MKKKAQAKPNVPHLPKPVAQVIPTEVAETVDDTLPVLERPDGFYWQSPGLAEVGPFETYELACASRDAVGDEVLGRSDTLQAERDIGINDWLDAETGAPAEGQSPPRLAKE